MLAKSNEHELVVAHFDHGIRPDSASDAEFVRNLASRYNLPFETKREELGPGTSEEKARSHRYTFLRQLAKKYDAQIVTAHHCDDLIETIAINLVRGTGWRGLAVLDSPDIYRPLLGMTKAQLVEYARQYHLDWREDSTNSDTKYLRNSLRQKLAAIDDQTRELLQRYRNRQVFLRQEADNESDRLVGASPYLRHLFIAIPAAEGLELLRAAFQREGVIVPTRPQLQRALHAIKVLHAGRRYEVSRGLHMQFTKTHFTIRSVR